MNSKSNQTFVCCTMYHVYIAMLKAFQYKKEGQQSLLILLKDGVDEPKNIYDAVEKIGVFNDVILIHGYTLVHKMKKKIGMANYLFNRSRSLVKHFEKHNPNLVEKKAFIENSEINLFQINRSKAYFLIQFKNNFFRMFEDGVGTYTERLKLPRLIMRKYVLRFPLLKGYDPQVKEVLVRYPKKMNDPYLAKKIRKLDLEAIENSLTEHEKKTIVKGFLNNFEITENSNRALIITQPLSEFNITTEAKKIAAYKSIIDRCKAEGFEVFIKNHPRDLTNYLEIDNSITVLPQQFPLEVLNLSETFNFRIGYTLFSTALENIKHVEEKVFLGKEYLDTV
ncbi:polysialyltransferase family glycosyltransferase [Lacinutrix salivirga]